MDGEGTQPANEEQLLQEAFVRWKDEPLIEVPLARADAYLLVGGLQLLCRNPGFPQNLKTTFASVARQLQKQVADTPELYALMEIGWDGAQDVKQS